MANERRKKEKEKSRPFITQEFASKLLMGRIRILDTEASSVMATDPHMLWGEARKEGKKKEQRKRATSAQGTR